MFQTLFKRLADFKNDKDSLTIWINNLIVVYAFFLPISGTVKSKIFIFILVLFVIRGDIWKHIKEAWSNKVIKAFFYFVAVFFIWLLGTDNFDIAFRNINHIKHILYILVFYMLVDGRYINKIIGAFILGMLLSEVISYLMLFEILPWELRIWGIKLYKSYRIGDPSPFLHHIHYGVLLTFTVILMIQRIMYGNLNNLIKYLLVIFSFTASFNIFVTGGRTGYISFFVMLCFLFFVYLRKWIVPAILVLSIFMYGVYNNIDILHKKVDQTIGALAKVNKEDPDFGSSLGVRLGIVYYGSKVIKDNWLFGVGTGDSFPEIAKILPPKNSFLADQKRLQHEHNVYLSVLLQFGVLGFLVFLNIYYQIIRFKQPEKDLRLVQLAVTLILSTAFLSEMFEMRTFLPMWALMLAITMRSRSHYVISEVKMPSDNTIIKQTLSLGVIFYIVVMVSKYHF